MHHPPRPGRPSSDPDHHGGGLGGGGGGGGGRGRPSLLSPRTSARHDAAPDADTESSPVSDTSCLLN